MSPSRCDCEGRWRRLNEEVMGDIQEWRRQHSRAPLEESARAVEERARPVAHVSPWGPDGSWHRLFTCLAETVWKRRARGLSASGLDAWCLVAIQGAQALRAFLQRGLDR